MRSVIQEIACSAWTWSPKMSTMSSPPRSNWWARLREARVLRPGDDEADVIFDSPAFPRPAHGELRRRPRTVRSSPRGAEYFARGAAHRDHRQGGGPPQPQPKVSNPRHDGGHAHPAPARGHRACPDARRPPVRTVSRHRESSPDASVAAEPITVYAPTSPRRAGVSPPGASSCVRGRLIEARRPGPTSRHRRPPTSSARVRPSRRRRRTTST